MSGSFNLAGDYWYTKGRDIFKIAGADQMQAYPTTSGVPTAPTKEFTAIGPYTGADIILIDGEFENAGVPQYIYDQWFQQNNFAD